MTDACPIVSACFHQLWKRVEEESLDMSSVAMEVLRYIDWRRTQISGEPEYVCLRGFIAIEKMLGILDLVTRSYTRHGEGTLPSFQLVSRSWGGLTVALDAIKDLMSEVALDETELKLGGVATTSDWKGRAAVNLRRRPGMGERASAALVSKAVPVSRLKALCPLIMDSIQALRPYLKNRNASVRVIGTNLASTLVVTDPPYRIEASLYTLRDLVEVRL